MTVTAHGSSERGRGCPVLHGFDPTTTEGNYASGTIGLLARAQSESPVFYMPEFDMYCVTRYDDARLVFRDYKRLSTEAYLADTGIAPEEIRAVAGEHYESHLTPDTLLATHPPKHTRVRRAFQPLLNLKVIAQHEDQIREYANELIDSFVEDKHADLVAQFAGPFAVGVVSDLFGLPKEWRPAFREYTAQSMAIMAVASLRSEPAKAAEALASIDWQAQIDFDRRFVEYVDYRRREPGDDFTSQAIETSINEDGEERLSNEEIATNIQGFAIAGSDTSVNAIAHAVYLLLTHPDQWAALQQDRSLIPNAVDETIRHHGGAGGVMRRAMTDLEVAGVTIPEGATIYMPFSACNYDETTFADPKAFDIHRPNAKDHLGFGRGIHRCLGEPIARTEAIIALDVFMDRLPNLRLSDPNAPLVYNPGVLIAILRELQVEWD